MRRHLTLQVPHFADQSAAAAGVVKRLNVKSYEWKTISGVGCQLGDDGKVCWRFHTQANPTCMCTAMPARVNTRMEIKECMRLL